MINLLPRNILRFALLVLIQVLVLNNIQLFGWANPFFYVLFVLLMPFETPKWLVLVMSFVLGMTVDSFSNTPGLHAAATVLMGYLRSFVLRIIAPRDGYEPGTFPRMYYYGMPWFLKYSGFLVLAHHIMLFSVEAFSFVNFHITLLHAVVSAIFSTLLIVVSQFFMYRK